LPDPLPAQGIDAFSPTGSKAQARRAAFTNTPAAL